VGAFDSSIIPVFLSWQARRQPRHAIMCLTGRLARQPFGRLTADVILGGSMPWWATGVGFGDNRISVELISDDLGLQKSLDPGLQLSRSAYGLK